MASSSSSTASSEATPPADQAAALAQGGVRAQLLLSLSPTGAEAAQTVPNGSLPSSPLSSGKGRLAYASLYAAADDDPLVTGEMPPVPELLGWRQSETLRPPPYPQHWRMREMLPGLPIGDPELDALSIEELRRAVQTGDLVLAKPPGIPDWVDPEAVRRGQQVYIRYLYPFVASLTSMLIHGYVVGRFSDVLVLSGYAASRRATFERFRSTGEHVFRWMSMDLFDPASEGYKSVLKVRAVHAMARRYCEPSWNVHQEPLEAIGVPLSQYDTQLVQLGFSAICMSLVLHQFGVPLTEQEQRDYVHLWRYLGHLLGIQDRFNCCRSLELALELRQEFYASCPQMARYPRPSCGYMARCTVSSFAYHLGLGEHFLNTMVRAYSRPWLDDSWMGLPAYPYSTQLFVMIMMKGLRTFSLLRRIASIFWYTMYSMALRTDSKSLRYRLVTGLLNPGRAKFWDTLFLFGELFLRLLRLAPQRKLVRIQLGQPSAVVEKPAPHTCPYQQQ